MTDGEAESKRPPIYRRYWTEVVGAARWVYDVLRGHAWSRHLDQQEK